MRIIVSRAGAGLSRYADRLAAFPAAALRAEVEGLNEGGDKLRTGARRDLRDQTGVKAYGSIVARTGQRKASAGSLEYSVLGMGKGLPIRDFPVSSGPGRPVTASPWRVSHTFSRSFQTTRKGLLRARLGPGRMPIRALYGPAVSKEIVKDRTAAHFVARAPELVLGPIVRRLGRLLP